MEMAGDRKKEDNSAEDRYQQQGHNAGEDRST
jgi:hypothetical protein